MDMIQSIITRIPDQHPRNNQQDPKWITRNVDEPRNHLVSTASGNCVDVPALNHQQANESKKKSQSKRAKAQSRYGSRYKRNRTIFNVAQLDALARIFQENRYPDAPLRKKIAERLDIEEERIQIWFQNRRAKTRRTQRKDGNDDSPANINPDDAESMNEYSPGVPTLAPDAPNTLHNITRQTPDITGSPQQINSSTSPSTGSATYPATTYATTKPVNTQNAERPDMPEAHPSQCNEYSYSNERSSGKQHTPEILTSSVPTSRIAPSNHPDNTLSVTTSTVPVPNSFTQHYITNGNGHTSRVHVNNEGRSTEGRLRPENRVLNPPPNQVCTALPDKDKNELSKALFRFGLAIGQSAGLDVDATQLVETQEPEEPQRRPISQVPQRHLPVKKRRRRDRKYPNSDTSSDSDEENSRKRYRRIPGGGIDRSGPPNRLATAVPESDRTLPAMLLNGNTNQDLAPVFDGVPDLLIDETCSQIEKEPPLTDALDSPFSIDILSSPEPRSSNKSPSSTSTSSLSDWSDFGESETVTSYQDSTKPSTNVMSEKQSEQTINNVHNRSENAGDKLEARGPVPMSQNIYPLPTLDHLHSSTRPFPPVEMDPGAKGDDTSCQSVDNTAQPMGLTYNQQSHSSGLHSESVRHRSFSDNIIGPAPHRISPIDQRNPPNVTIGQRSEVEQGKSSPLTLEHTELHRTDWKSMLSYSSSSASEENRRNQVSEIMAESRMIADYMSNSSPASPALSEDSGSRSPASWLLPRSPQSFAYIHPHEANRSEHHLPQASVSYYDHQFQSSARTSPSTSVPHGHFPTYMAASPSGYQYPSHSFASTGRSSHSVIKPVATLPTMPYFQTHYRPPFNMC